MDLNEYSTGSISDTIQPDDFQTQHSVAYSYPNMDINSNFTMTDSTSFQYDKTIPHYVTTSQNIHHEQNLISTQNEMLQHEVFEIPMENHDKMVDTGQNYLSETGYADPSQILNISQYNNKIGNTQYTSDVNNYQQTQNYLYNPQETIAANQTVISNPFTGFAQYPQPVTSHSYSLQTNLHDIGEIIPSVDYTTNSNLGIHASQNSSCLLESSENSNQVSFADILLEHNSSNNTTFSTGSGTLSASDLEVLSSCLQISQNDQLSSSEQTVNPEIMLNQPQNSEMMYTHFQHTEVAANEDCVTSELYEDAPIRTPVEDDRTTMKVSVKEEKTARDKRKQFIVWDDVASLPEKITLPLPSYCDCENIEIDMEEKIKQQSYIKNKKEIILRHVGRVVINDIELCSFVRNGTAYISHEQLFSTGIFNKAANPLISSCGKSFPSFVDRLLVEEREYMRQKEFLRVMTTKSSLFSIGIVAWIVDYLNRDVNDTERTIVYEKYLGHHCQKYKNMKSWQTPTPLPVPIRTYIRTKPKNKNTGNNLVTTCLVQAEKMAKFTVAEIGRLMFSDKTLAAFVLDDGREIVFVNFYQVVSYATGLTLAEFHSLVKEFNCRLIKSPEGVRNHFRNLKQEIPTAFLDSEWIRLSSFKQICSFLLGKLHYKHPAKIYITQILKSKPREIFGQDLKISVSKITFPVLETRLMNSGDILSMAAASANIETDVAQNSETSLQPSSQHSQVRRKATSRSNIKENSSSQSQLKLQKFVVSRSKGQIQNGRGGMRLHLPKPEIISKTCAVQTDLDLEDVCESEPNIDLTDDHVDNSTSPVSKVTAPSCSNSTSVSKTVLHNDQNSVTETNSPVSKVKNACVSDSGSKTVSNSGSKNSADCGSQTFFDDTNCEPKTNLNGGLKYQDAATGSDQENGGRMKVADAELSTAIETINDLDFLNESFEMSSSSPEKLQIDLSASRNNVSTPVVSESENISNERKEHTIMSNPNVTVIANNSGEEIYECVPLFSLADLVQKDEENLLNPYSPFKSTENRLPVVNQLEENDYSESFNNQSLSRNRQNGLDSFEDSFGPMKKGCINSNANSKTLNQVILGDEPSDWTLSPQKSSNTMTSLFDTPKTSPRLERSGSKSPRLQSLYQKFNRLEREATPNTSLHFFAEIASASVDMVENNSTSSKKKSRTAFPVQLLKHVSKVSSFLNQNLRLSKATISQNQFILDIKLKKDSQELYLQAVNDPSVMESFEKLLKLTVLLVSKICSISELQKNLDLMKNGKVSETQTDDLIESEQEEETDISFTEIRSPRASKRDVSFTEVKSPSATKTDAKVDENITESESNLSQNTSNTLQTVDNSTWMSMCQSNTSEGLDVQDYCDKEMETRESNCVINIEKTSSSAQNIPLETVSSSPEKSSPSKYKSRKRKLKDIFPQNEDRELNGVILNQELDSSDVEIHSPNSKKSKLVSDKSEKTKMRNNKNVPSIDLDCVSSDSEIINNNCESPGQKTSKKYPMLLQGLLSPCPSNSKPILNTSISRKTPHTDVSENVEPQSELEKLLKGDCGTHSSIDTNSSQQTPKKQSLQEQPCKTHSSIEKNSSKLLKKRSLPKKQTLKTNPPTETNSSQNTCKTPSLQEKQTPKTQSVPDNNSQILSGKRIRKKTVKYLVELPKPKSGKKRKKISQAEFYKNWEAKISKPMPEVVPKKLPRHEIYAYIPPKYGFNDKVIDDTTKIIPASKFRKIRKPKTIQDMSKECEFKPRQNKTVLNSPRLEEREPLYSVIDANGKTLPTPRPDNANRSVSMSSGIVENGEKYEIFQSF